jgi:hypothetical protein
VKVAPATIPEELELLDDELELLELLEPLEEELELLEDEFELVDELELEEDELLDELVVSVLDPPQAVNTNRKPVIKIFFILSPAE